jgi:DNA ligase-1
MERLIKQDKHNRDRYIDIKVEDLKDGTADIVKISGIVGSDKFSESRTNVRTGYEKALKRAQTMWNNEHTKCKQGQYVDGEAFDPNLNFEELTSTFKTDPLKLKFHVFDFFDLKAEALARDKMTFEQRWEYVKDSIYNPHYEYVKTTLVKSKKDLPLMHQKHVEEGHEGTMIRDRFSVYEVGQRSNYLLKHKDFQTEEYEITGAKTGHGRDADAVVWVCKTQDGQQFTVRPEGTIVQREEDYRNHEKYIGKMLTVRFQNLTAIGVPRFPVGVVIRDYE